MTVMAGTSHTYLTNRLVSSPQSHRMGKLRVDKLGVKSKRGLDALVAWLVVPRAVARWPRARPTTRGTSGWANPPGLSAALCGGCLQPTLPRTVGACLKHPPSTTRSAGTHRTAQGKTDDHAHQHTNPGLAVSTAPHQGRGC
mgnify:CR=1 FL=1